MTQQPPTPDSRISPREIRELRERLGLSQTEFAAKLDYAPRTILRWEQGAGRPKGPVIQAMQGLISRRPPPPDTSPAFSFIDLFAGIGGLRLGFEAAGGQCLFTSEWDPYCQLTYRANFGEDHPIAGDIRAIDAADIPSHDVLLAGFPCQPFSIAGVSKKNSLGRPHGFACEAQGTLFYEVSRVLKFHRPKAFLLENVKNLRTHDGGNTFRVIMKVLREELGYYATEVVLDAKGVVPQHRERVYIAGFRDFNGFDWDGLNLPVSAGGPTLRAILHPEDGSESPEDRYTDEDGRVNPKYILTGNLWTYLQNYARKHKAKGNGFGFGLVGRGGVARTLSARYYKDGSEILIKRGRGRPRRLTPRECARLMGFDRPGQEPFKIPVSDTRAYKQFGNAVVVPVVEAVAKYMRPYILDEAAETQQFVLALKPQMAMRSA